ncbi:MAG: sigma-70 family RNA polymerase sigma factor [Fibrobacterales bacterium]
MRPEEIYTAHKDGVFRICRRYTHCDHDAEDLLQETFIKVFRSIDSYDGTSQMFTWIYRIATNNCLDYLRSKKGKDALSIDYIEEIPCKNVGREDTDRNLTLQKILKTFNKESRELLFLFYIEGLNHGEIADIMGVSRVAITRRIKRLEAKFPDLAAIMIVCSFFSRSEVTSLLLGSSNDK